MDLARRPVHPPAQAAPLARTTLGAVLAAMGEGRLRTGADGLIGGLALFGWYVNRTRGEVNNG